jgi:hypothetical protein
MEIKKEIEFDNLKVFYMQNLFIMRSFKPEPERNENVKKTFLRKKTEFTYIGK